MKTTSFSNLLRESRVVIPIMQRDYAQGRQSEKIRRVRAQFVNALFSALKSEGLPLKLDFIYGYRKELEDGQFEFIPLDGQQRLTALYLLHWYAAVKEDRLTEASALLSNFTYETRHSSRVFCQEIVKFKPEDLDQPLSSCIQDQPWFFSSWRHDPTIQSMLVMLDAIQEKDKKENCSNLWDFLTTEEKIVFYLLPMDELGNPDDLYIKMNSRGKELTEFEYFKSRFSESLPGDLRKEFDEKVDRNWSDLFWVSFRDEATEDPALFADKGFLRFYRYITDILVQLSQNGDGKVISSQQELELGIYHDKPENIKFLFGCLDALYTEVVQNGNKFFSQLFYIEEEDFTKEKTRLFFANSNIDLFRKCAQSYDNTARVNPFSVGEQLLLFACLLKLRDDTVVDDKFRNNLRVLRNMISNTEDRMRREDLPGLLQDVIDLVKRGKLSEETRLSADQLREEREKAQFLANFPELKDALYRAEDHRLLRGCLALFPLDEMIGKKLATFRQIFTPNTDFIEISRALMSTGDYYRQGEVRIIIGHEKEERWRELFSRSGRSKRFVTARDTLDEFLCLMPEEDYEPGRIIERFLAAYEENPDKEKPFNYYYVKYPAFRRNYAGYYYWPDSGQNYECRMLRATTTGGNNWSPFLFALKERYGNDDRISLGNYFNPLVVIRDTEALEIENDNAGYLVKPHGDEHSETFEELKSRGIIDENGLFKVRQNQEGFDLDDRIDEGASLIDLIIS